MAEDWFNPSEIMAQLREAGHPDAAAFRGDSPRAEAYLPDGKTLTATPQPGGRVKLEANGETWTANPSEVHRAARPKKQK